MVYDITGITKQNKKSLGLKPKFIIVGGTK